MKRFAALFLLVITLSFVSCDTDTMNDDFDDGKTYITYTNATSDTVSLLVWDMEKLTGNPSEPYEIFYRGDIAPGKTLKLQQDEHDWYLVGYIHRDFTEDDYLFTAKIKLLSNITIKIINKNGVSSYLHGKFIDLRTGDYMDL